MDNRDILGTWICYRHDIKVKEEREKLYSMSFFFFISGGGGGLEES